MSDNNGLKKIIAGIPDEPGVYLMKDGSATIVYIGKAASLRKRVSSYFHKRDHDIKTRMLVSVVRDIETIVTDSEMEALILESTLIKKHRPKFNIQKKDDKRYPYIAVTLGEDYPRVIYTRSVKKDGTRYFGPYTDAKAARNMADMINSMFRLKRCTRELPLKRNERPCINFQISKCAGACRGEITRDEYRAIVSSAIQFLEGGVEPVVKNLHDMMKRFSENREYEKAGVIRDMISDISAISETQKVQSAVGTDQDYIGVSKFGDEGIIILFEFRGGALLGRKISVYQNAEFAGMDEIISSFIAGYYETAEIPRRIIIEKRIADRQVLQKYLTARATRRVLLTAPETADDRGIMRMIHKNIDIIASDRYAERETRNTLAGLEEMKKLIGTGALPRVIECFDISNLQGSDAVASMVQFRDGLPERSGYRRYRIRGYSAPDDPGMIHEVVSRRVQHLVNEGLPLPDLLVIDGGRTQLSRAREAARNFSADIKIISLAKRFEEIYCDPLKEPVRLPESSQALRILQAIRDEAHRFAITYHRTLRDRKTTQSVLDEIGIGRQAKRLLLERFKSVDVIRKATREELEGTRGIGPRTAIKIYEFFRK